MKFFVYFSALLVVISLAISPTFSEGIGFLEDAPTAKREQNAQNRKPYFVPGKCNANEYLYPGDQADDWICDCAPGHLYHPETDDCYLAFRQGPCDKGSILVLGANSVIPQCIKSKCEDGMVEIQQKCHPFGESDLCQPKQMKMLGVNTSTFLVDCVDKPFVTMTIATRLGEEEKTTTEKPTIHIPKCPKGSKRFQSGRCPKNDSL